MPINTDKPHLWKPDIARSVDLFNSWFMKSAPAAYRATRAATTQQVKNALEHTNDLRYLVPETIKRHPEVLPTLRMSTAPPTNPATNPSVTPSAIAKSTESTPTTRDTLVP